MQYEISCFLHTRSSSTSISNWHLFDTFAGFDAKDLSVEAENNYSEELEGHFKETSVELVISRMPHPKRCIVHKGYFPDHRSTSNRVRNQFVPLSAQQNARIITNRQLPNDPVTFGSKLFHCRAGTLISRGIVIMNQDNPLRDVAFQERCADRYGSKSFNKRRITQDAASSIGYACRAGSCM